MKQLSIFSLLFITFCISCFSKEEAIAYNIGIFNEVKFQSQDTDTNKTKKIILTWHEIQSTLSLQTESSLTVFINDSILLDTLYNIQSMNDYILNWFIDSVGSLVEIETNKLKIITDTTLYLSILESNGCTFFDNIKVKAQNLTLNKPNPIGVAEISLYPNPNTGEFFVNFKKAKPGKYGLSIKDALGKQVYRKEFSKYANFQEYINLNNVAGYFIVTIYYKNAIINRLPVIIY